MKENLEIEIKVKIQKLNILLQELNNRGNFIEKTREIDEYYTPKHRDFTKAKRINEWFRLRTNDGIKTSINYKKWYFSKDGSPLGYCDEFETIISDYQQFKKILSVLNFKYLIKVDKVREKWIYQNYEICIDNVKKLGIFVEVEFKGIVDKDPEKIANEMVLLLKKLKCGKIQRNQQGYPFLLMFPNKSSYQLIN